MPPSSIDEDVESADVATVSLEPDPNPSASSASTPPAPRGGAAPENVGAASFSPEVLASGDIASHLALESECARLRAARARAEAEAERLAAELAAFKAHAPEPEEMDALRDEAAALRERVAVLASEDGKESKESLRADVHDAVVLAAAALAGGPAARSAAEKAAPPRPARRRRRPRSWWALCARRATSCSARSRNSATRRARFANAAARKPPRMKLNRLAGT